jgi:DNA (cytosine-5)-methyltransferase 1
MGKCYITYLDNLNENVEEWSAMGPNRFYFSKSYDSKNEQFIEPSLLARKIGKNLEVDSCTKSKNKIDLCSINKPICYPYIPKKLKMFDIFSGCGGIKSMNLFNLKFVLQNTFNLFNIFRIIRRSQIIWCSRK